jgi:long-chain acyl-CoA synthetase
MLDLSRLSCLGEALRDAVLTFKSSDALIEADRHRQSARYSYAQLQAEAERVGACMQLAGLQPGDRCAILMSNQSKWVISAFSAIWAGAVLVPLDYKLRPDEQLALIAHCKPKLIITEFVVWRALLASQAASEALGGAQVFVTEAPVDADLRPAGFRAERWEAPARSALRFVGRAPDDLACIVYSSGTGGSPKGCMLTHDNYLRQAEALAWVADIGEGDRYFSIIPTNHAIDFMCGVVMAFLFGAAVVHQRTLRAEFLASTMKRYGITHTALVPRLLRVLRTRIEEQLDALPAWQRRAIDSLASVNELATARTVNHGLSRLLLKPIHDRFGGRLRMIFAGGAFVDPALAEFFYRLGLPVVIGYGLTEACTVLTVNDLKPFRATTVGRPVRGVELQVRDRDQAGVGEVYARGRTIMAGYLDAPELTREALIDGWLRTGDLGTIDASGHLRLWGRSKNMIVTDGGKNVYPEDVEATFERIECEELCVFATSYLWSQRGRAGDELVLVVRPREGQSPAALRAAIASANLRLADFKRVTSYVLWPHEFPKTASMKIKRAELAVQLRVAGQRAEMLRAS